jgi:hypothetical protein
MSLSMPIPLIELLQVENIVGISKQYYENSSALFGCVFKDYQQNIWQK